MTTPDQFPDAGDMVPTVVAFLDAQGHPRHVKFVPSANDRRHCAPFRPLITQEAHELFVAALMARLEAAERDAERYQWTLHHLGLIEAHAAKWSPAKHRPLLVYIQDFIDNQRAAIASEAKP